MMINLRASVKLTNAFHRWIAQHVSSQQASELLDHCNRELHQRGIALNPQKPLKLTLSSFLLTKADEQSLIAWTKQLFDITEQTVDHVLSSPQLLEDYFPGQKRLLPYLQKTRGIRSWQVYGRYDVAVDCDGNLSLIEINASRSGGLFISDIANELIQTCYESIDSLISDHFGYATVDSGRVVDEMLQLEARSNLTPGLVGLLYDENNNTNELHLLERAIQERGREVEILPASELTFENGVCLHRGRRISLTHNRFRISVPQPRFSCWQEGFESRYAGWLAAQKEHAIVSVNTLASHGFAGNKTLLALMSHSDVIEIFSEQDREFIRKFMPANCVFPSAQAPSLEEVIDNKDKYVIKPANQSGGNGVLIGLDLTEQQWTEACHRAAEMPHVLQKYVESLQLEVPEPTIDGEMNIHPMNLILGLSFFCGQYQGCISRLSHERVTNVVRSGYPQPVFRINDPAAFESIFESKLIYSAAMKLIQRMEIEGEDSLLSVLRS